MEKQVIKFEVILEETFINDTYRFTVDLSEEFIASICEIETGYDDLLRMFLSYLMNEFAMQVCADNGVRYVRYGSSILIGLQNSLLIPKEHVTIAYNLCYYQIVNKLSEFYIKCLHKHFKTKS